MNHALTAIAGRLESHLVIFHGSLAVSDSSSGMLIGKNPREKCEKEACQNDPFDDESSLFQNANVSASPSLVFAVYVDVVTGEYHPPELFTTATSC